MAGPLFYNQGDQDIYNSGTKFLPQEKYRLNKFTAPTAQIQPVPTSSGITNTNAFNNGGSDFSVYNPDPNSIVNRNYNPYPFRQAESPIDEGSDPSYFTPPEPTGVKKLLGSLSNFIPGKGIAQFVGDYLPPNRRSIMENQLSGQGVMVNNIGQIVSDGRNINTAENVMAGYNPSKMTAATFDKRLDKIKETMNKDGYKGNLQEKYDAIVAAKQNFLDANDESEDIYNFKKKQKQVKRDKTALGRYLNKRDRVALAKKQINPTGPSNSKRGTPGGSADRFTLDDGRTYDNSRGDFRNADGSNVSQDFNNTSASLDNYDASALYAKGGRAGYFFGGRVGFKDGGLASIL